MARLWVDSVHDVQCASPICSCFNSSGDNWLLLHAAGLVSRRVCQPVFASKVQRRCVSKQPAFKVGEFSRGRRRNVVATWRGVNLQSRCKTTVTHRASFSNIGDCRGPYLVSPDRKSLILRSCLFVKVPQILQVQALARVLARVLAQALLRLADFQAHIPQHNL